MATDQVTSPQPGPESSIAEVQEEPKRTPTWLLLLLLGLLVATLLGFEFLLNWLLPVG